MKPRRATARRSDGGENSRVGASGRGHSRIKSAAFWLPAGAEMTDEAAAIVPTRSRSFVAFGGPQTTAPGAFGDARAGLKPAPTGGWSRGFAALGNALAAFLCVLRALRVLRDICLGRPTPKPPDAAPPPHPACSTTPTASFDPADRCRLAWPTPAPPAAKRRW